MTDCGNGPLLHWKIRRVAMRWMHIATFFWKTIYRESATQRNLTNFFKSVCFIKDNRDNEGQLLTEKKYLKGARRNLRDTQKRWFRMAMRKMYANNSANFCDFCVTTIFHADAVEIRGKESDGVSFWKKIAEIIQKLSHKWFFIKNLRIRELKSETRWSV